MAEPVSEQALHAVVHGTVQGVGFRYYAKHRAASLGLVGWVRNNPDGTVEVWAEGRESALSGFETFLKDGPPAANVARLDVRRPSALGTYHSFKVDY